MLYLAQFACFKCIPYYSYYIKSEEPLFYPHSPPYKIMLSSLHTRTVDNQAWKRQWILIFNVDRTCTSGKLLLSFWNQRCVRRLFRPVHQDLVYWCSNWSLCLIRELLWCFLVPALPLFIFFLIFIIVFHFIICFLCPHLFLLSMSNVCLAYFPSIDVVPLIYFVLFM